MFDPAAAIAHLKEAEEKAAVFVEDLRPHVEAAEAIVAGLRAAFEAANKLVDGAREARAEAETAAAVLPTLADVKALVDRLV